MAVQKRMDKLAGLTPDVVSIVLDCATEKPFSGEYYQFDGIGTYLCRRCGQALFRSTDKFLSSCGWPSFDDEIKGTIKRRLDKDGRRQEILCERCDAHLGHVFIGEYITEKNLRHCVNSLAVDFVEDKIVIDSKELIVAAGCFWGVEYYFNQQDGVLKTEVGFCGGQLQNPSYDQVCYGNTGHLESVRVIYDANRVNLEDLVKLFFEIHDPTQATGQGPDIGSQYMSALFYYDDEQKNCQEQVIALLREKDIHVVTKLLPVSIFWKADNFHQAYYLKQNKEPTCHVKRKLF
jgi:peptide methionine sulfoxide reductase msrA/msrB